MTPLHRFALFSLLALAASCGSSGGASLGSDAGGGAGAGGMGGSAAGAGGAGGSGAAGGAVTGCANLPGPLMGQAPKTTSPFAFAIAFDDSGFLYFGAQSLMKQSATGMATAVGPFPAGTTGSTVGALATAKGGLVYAVVL